MKKLEDLINDFSKMRILVLGDVMLDYYIYGNATRLSPEAPVPVVRATGEKYHLGGAANVAANIASLGVKVGKFNYATGFSRFYTLPFPLAVYMTRVAGMLADTKELLVVAEKP